MTIEHPSPQTASLVERMERLRDCLGAGWAGETIDAATSTITRLEQALRELVENTEVRSLSDMLDKPISDDESVEVAWVERWALNNARSALLSQTPDPQTGDTRD